MYKKFQSFCLAIFIGMFGLNSFASSQDVKAPLFDNLGSFHREISTKVPLAQRFFDQGVVFFYGFEWSEAVRSFQEATRLDPNCAMCFWGLALALGNKANAPMTGHEYSDGKMAIQKAMTLKSRATPVEQSLITVLAKRFQHTPKKSVKMADAFSCHTNAGENASKKEILNYADAMKKLSQQYPNDNDVKALYAYALFDVIEWKFWDYKGKINPRTSETLKALKSILASDSSHIGGNHYFVHVVEQSPVPADALPSADFLKTAVPGSEHLVHMPAHIYFLTGRYHEATESNQQAIAVYQTYSKLCRDQGFEPLVTYLYYHDFDYLRTTATYEGRKTIALNAAKQLMENLPAAWIEKDISLQWFIPIEFYVQARFGMWDDILKIPAPKNQYQYALGMWHYVRGMAFAHTDHLSDAAKEANALQKIIQKGETKNSLGKTGLHLLTIANHVLVATLADRKGDEKTTLANLKKAAQIQYEMGYHEPPDWYFPMKEMLGDAYLKWGHPVEAIAMYNQNLKQYPKNAWALYGLFRALKKQGNDKQAAQVEKEFNEAWQHAEIKVPVVLFL